MANSLHLKKFKATLGFDELLDFIKKDWERSYSFIFLFMAIVISYNYYYDLKDSYFDLYENSLKGLLLFLSLNICVYGVPLILMIKNDAVRKAVKSYRFWSCLLLSLLLLSFYQSTNLSNLCFPEWHNESYYNRKIGNRLNSIAKYIFIFVILGVLIGQLKNKAFGVLNFKINYKTYMFFLLIMLPLIIFASTQQDFLNTYPKLKQVNIPFNAYIKQLLIFEPLYLIDFVMLEWFFRGFMVLFFARYLNQKSIILVALVYCSFHFGKPVLECISSFFGGYLLGYIVYKTKSVWGGVIVHIGIAFMMDLFAFLAINH